MPEAGRDGADMGASDVDVNQPVPRADCDFVGIAGTGGYLDTASCIFEEDFAGGDVPEIDGGLDVGVEAS